MQAQNGPDPRELRRCLARFATGVTVVTYRPAGGTEPRGATINSFVSVSLDPPLVLVSIARTARARDGLTGAPFVVNVLAANQLDLALCFAGRPRAQPSLPWVPDAEVPRLRGCLAWFECQPFNAVEAGDHVLFLGQVMRHDRRAGEVLLFHGGQFRLPGPVLAEQPRVLAPTPAPVLDWLRLRTELQALTDEGVRADARAL
ncbi:MAG TPA: flavin reductase family protein [Pseudonocardia sp.]|jgi:flavin reductase (DIM6/NTAB) family NADH-FMN oxidoreductase RutF